MMHADSDPFFEVPRVAHPTSEGQVELPIKYYDVTNVLALFVGDRAGAEKLLVNTGLELAFGRGAKTLVGLSFYEYRHTTVGTYNEVGVALFCVPPGRRPSLWRVAELYAPLSWRSVGAYVVDLPVTTAAADAAGRELWGYPKFVTDIPFRLDDRTVDTSVLDPDDGSTICQLAGTFGRGVPAPPMSLVTYSRKQGALIRAEVNVRGRVEARLPGSARLRVGESEHPMALRLRTLGLTAAKPMAALVTDRFQSLLHGGSRVGG